MITEDNEWNVCDEPGCEAKIKNHYWGNVKADTWLHMKDGASFCPDHLPDWAKGRLKKRKK